MGIPRTKRRGGARPGRGGYLRPGSVSRSKRHLLVSAAATLASRIGRGARRSLLHLQSHILVRIPLLRRPPPRSYASPVAAAWWRPRLTSLGSSQCQGRAQEGPLLPPWSPCLPSPAQADLGPGGGGPVRGSPSMAPRSCQHKSPWGRAAARKCPSGPLPPRGGKQDSNICQHFFCAGLFNPIITMAYNGPITPYHRGNERLRTVKTLAQGHPARKWLSCN